MSGQTYFITGGNKGIGFELVTQLSKASDKNVIITTTRSPERAKKLYELATKFTNIHVIDLDVGDAKSIDTIEAQLDKIGVKGIDVFISNAGIFASLDPILKTDADVFLRHYTVNTLGSILVFQKVYKYLLAKETRKVIFISSVAGSFSNTLPLDTTAYGQSKVALNYSAVQLSKELVSENFIVIPLHPGAVYTESAQVSLAPLVAARPELFANIKDLMLTPEESVKGVISVIDGLEPKDSGIFYDYKGEALPF
ncbi:putative short chain dehydrogenase [Scheffersomyces coipomensis]|uniref:putative short chain dehydrogenase n=1 Tax=Scheffersomyces coipomensis TaxID=1788519 RepID=UPI00315C553C